MLMQFVDWWSSVYAAHAMLRTSVEFTHIAGLVAGGGAAITADLATVTAARAKSATLAVQLRLLKRTHPIVIFGLTALFASGLLLFAADMDTFWFSRLFWLKMALVGVLVINGVVLVTGEHNVVHAETNAWRRLHVVAIASLAFWLLTTFAGSALTNLG